MPASIEHPTLAVPIDTYGRWGKLFEEYIQAYCQRAAGNDTKLYNFLITRARNTVSVSLGSGPGKAVRRTTCFSRTAKVCQ